MIRLGSLELETWIGLEQPVGLKCHDTYVKTYNAFNITHLKKDDKL